MLLSLIISSVSMAKPFTLDDKLQPMRLELTPMRDFPESKGGYVDGRVNPEGHYFYVKGHGMMQPVDVVLTTSEKADVALEIYLSTWESPVRASSTGTEGITAEKLKVYGEFGIRVIGKDAGAPYFLSLLAWPEQVPDLGNPFVPNPAHEKTSPVSGAPPNPVDPDPVKTIISDATSPVIYILGGLIVGMLVVVIGLLSVLVLRKSMRDPKTVIFILSLCAAGTFSVYSERVAANDGARPASSDERNYYNGRLPDPSQYHHDRGGVWAPDGEAAFEVMDKSAARTMDYLKRIKEGYEAWDAYHSLDTCMRISSPPDVPTVPSFCADGASAFGASEGRCSQCFTEARQAFNKARLDLEKLRVIYSCTQKMTKAALSAGDTMSGVHGYTGIVWQKMRQDIVQSVNKMEGAYDQKYPELMKNLHESMKAMGICEAQYGMPDWYDRMGFIYYEFMRDAYKRKD